MIGGIIRPGLRKRVVTIFVIAVLFPCLFLGYIGLKSIKQEKQWQQQLVNENLERSLSLTIEQIESAFDDQIRSLLGQLSPPPQLTVNYINSLRKIKTQSSMVQEVFLLNKDLRLIFPKTYKNVVSTGINNLTTMRLQEDEHFRSGDLLEASDKLNQAINEYQKGYSEQTSVSLRAALLSRIARCQFKMGDYENGVKSYQKIIKDDNNQFYGEEMPYVLVAYLQLLGIAETNNQLLDVNTRLLDFYQFLVEHTEKLEQAQYKFCIDQVHSQLQNRRQHLSLSQRAVLASIEKVEQEIDGENDFLRLLQINILPEINSKITGNLQLNNSTGRKDILYKSGVSDSVDWTVAIHVNDDSKSPIRIIGIRIKSNALIDKTLVLLKESQPKEELHVALVNAEGHILAPEELSSAAIVLKKPFTRFQEFAQASTLALVTMGKNPIETISSKSLIIYYILLGSVIILIAFGIVFILRDISREERISTMKSEFIANVSHEIKTPIATIRTLSENLNEGWVTGEEKQKEYFHLIEREAEHLTHLVENILDFSRIERGNKNYRMEAALISEVTKKVVTHFRSLMDGQGVNIKENIENNLPMLMLDIEAYEQALLNLLDNAVKYSLVNKVIEVNARLQSDYIIVEVSDHGIGISKKDCEKIFEKFFRSTLPDERKIPGSGIGLTLVKEIVEAHGGTIEVISEIGKGSTFTISFPLSKDNSQKPIE